MASAILTRTRLGHCLIHSSYSVTHKPRLLTSYFTNRSFHFQATPTLTAYKTPLRIPFVMASSMVGRRTNFSTRTLSANEPVVSADWLHANLKEPDLKVSAYFS
ncbi:thiosulfate/3-mercaptopyruvate sulfurtransferase 1, mitochondrial-like [Juglans regia]|uniref:Thiosulfate/3-mercaptopyruvate sulfurtransferase 1, mitochondrial-like n=1 Tax=Juglans regia TaxID=51240 RepID=A0A6P9E7W9_JUGRE|nr:thiosulfate/3-mercaptopyruvate sulfurtransferase 1, mitochondrial-like [Juglans regia]